MQAIDVDAVEPSVIQEFESVWRSQWDGKRIPSAQYIDPSAIARLMPHLMVLEVCGEASAGPLKTRLVGSAHRKIADSLHAGDILDEVDAAHADRARQAATTGQPVYWRTDGDLSTDIGAFPFAADGKTVDRIVSIVVGPPPKRRFAF